MQLRNISGPDSPELIRRSCVKGILEIQTFLDEFEDDLHEHAVPGWLQRVVAPLPGTPAARRRHGDNGRRSVIGGEQ